MYSGDTPITAMSVSRGLRLNPAHRFRIENLLAATGAFVELQAFNRILLALELPGPIPLDFGNPAASARRTFHDPHNHSALFEDIRK
jgi:hypothetical protein